ncbi:unnamed protein product, partial [marine sediment metagenome]
MGIFSHLPTGARGFIYPYKIEYSRMMDVSNSHYLNRVFGSPTDNNKWTMSIWVKISELAAANVAIFSQYVDANNYAAVYWTATHQIQY